MLTASFMDYQMPRADDLPDIRMTTREVPTKVNPLGAKGVGEAGTVGAMAAAMNAVNDALAPLGIRHFDMPATPNRVWAAIAAARRMSEPLFHMVAGAPTPVAPFSHAVEVDGWVFLTGQMPTLPDDDTAPLPEGIEAQTRRVMDNLIIVLRGLGLGLQHVVSVRAYPDAVRAGLRADECGVPQLLPVGSASGAHLRRCHGTGARRAGGDRPDRASIASDTIGRQ